MQDNIITLAQLMNDLNITNATSFPNELAQEYDMAVSDYKSQNDAIVNEKYLNEINDKYKVFTEYWPVIINDAAKIRSRPDLLIYAYLLKRLIGNRDFPDKDIVRKLTASTPLNPADYYFTPLFSMMPYIPPMVEDMKRRDVPGDIINGTISEFEDKIRDFIDRNQTPGISNYIYWLKIFTDMEIFRIGRFNLQLNKKFPGSIVVYKRRDGKPTGELSLKGADPTGSSLSHQSYIILATGVSIHKSGMILGSAGCEDTEGSFEAVINETSEYYEGFPVGQTGLVKAEKIHLPKTAWEVALQKDDYVISVHIPARLSLESGYCDSSYKRAREIFQRHYPEYAYKAFMCQSWMMDPQLKTLLGRETNLTRFIDRYMSYPTKAAGTGVMNFVFFKSGKPEIGGLPENTSLMRAIKNHYLAGKYVYEMGGVFF